MHMIDLQRPTSAHLSSRVRVHACAPFWPWLNWSQALLSQLKHVVFIDKNEGDGETMLPQTDTDVLFWITLACCVFATCCLPLEWVSTACTATILRCSHQNVLTVLPRPTLRCHHSSLRIRRLFFFFLSLFFFAMSTCTQLAPGGRPLARSS